MFFKIKRNTKLSKLQGAYANKVGKDVGSIRCGSVSFFPFSPVSWINAGCFTLVQFFIFNEKKKTRVTAVLCLLTLETFGIAVK